MTQHYLLIESSTETCSVGIAKGTKLVESIIILEPRTHASLLAPSVSKVLEKAQIDISQIAAVCVSEGPGSYTGLRVGVSVAKGICYGRSIPIIGIGTLDILAQMALEYVDSENSLIIPMIDARRMEVYTAHFECANNSGEIKVLKSTEVEAKILDAYSFEAEFNSGKKLIFIGDGVAKFRDILPEDKLKKCCFIPTTPTVEGMPELSHTAFSNKDFGDSAYFEPFYLKSFVAGTPKKLL